MAAGRRQRRPAASPGRRVVSNRRVFVYAARGPSVFALAAQKRSQLTIPTRGDAVNKHTHTHTHTHTHKLSLNRFIFADDVYGRWWNEAVV